MTIAKRSVRELLNRLYSDLKRVRAEESRILGRIATLEGMIEEYDSADELESHECQMKLNIENESPSRGIDREFSVTIGKTNYEQGFFNVPVTSDGAIPVEVQECTVILPNGVKTNARINRSQNPNGTARILIGAALKWWFQENFEIGDSVPACIVDSSTIMLGHYGSLPQALVNGHAETYELLR